MKSAKFSEVFKFSKPEYVYLKVTPNNSIRNQSTYKIAKSISSIYRGIHQRIKIEERKLIKFFKKEVMIPIKLRYQMNEKIGYYIYMEKKKIEFYFIVPKQFRSVLEEKMTDVWSGVTIEVVTTLPKFGDNAVRHQLVYDKEDALSLQVDRRDNDLLRSNLNVTSVLEEGDRMALFYNFIPITQHGWKSKHKYTLDKVNNYQPVDRDKSKGSYIFKVGMNMFSSIINEILTIFVDKKKGEESKNLFVLLLERMGKKNELLPETIKKENNLIIKAQVMAISESENINRKYNNVKSLTQSFETISGDNKLIGKRTRGKFDPTKYTFDKVGFNYFSDIECGNFISLAGRDILEEYAFIDKIETKETQVPEELTEGKFCIGENTFRGNKQKAFMSTDKEFQFLSLILIGPNRAGKTTLIGNLGKDAIEFDETVVNFDFIGNCELSDEMSELFPPDRILNIVCDQEDKLQGLGYNEIPLSDDPFKQYANAKLQTTQLTTLINSINSQDQPLTTRMERYLQSAANVTFITGGSINNVFEVLQDHRVRHSFIEDVPDYQLERMQKYIDSLYELDETKENKDTKIEEVVGTRYSRVDGIIDRLNKLEANPYMEQMLKLDTKNNFNLVDEFQKSQLINIRMPESMFSTDNEKDVYTTYWMTKIWLALQQRKSLYKSDRSKMKKVNLFIDELYQVSNTEKFLTDKLSRLPKFNIKPIISCHYLNQIKQIREELRSANASYMLIAGCDKKNFKELESELYPYKEEDLLNLKRFHSLNLIKIRDGYGKFITLMPKPIHNK
jgi:hypothetical protein